MIKYWCNQLRMPSNFNTDILETAMALPFLPPDLMERGVNELTLMADNMNDNRIHRFVRYIRRNWLPLSEIMSVYMLAIRTNNTCELFHKNAHKKLGDHPTLFKFISKIKLLVTSLS